MFTCDTCRREYKSKKSLSRHVKERHVELKHYPCAVGTCDSRFIRKSYLLTHLRKVHDLDRATAKTLSATVKLQKDPPKNTYEEVSDNEDFFENLPDSPLLPVVDEMVVDESVHHMVDDLIYSQPATSDANNNLQSLVETSDGELGDVTPDVNVSPVHPVVNVNVNAENPDFNYFELIAGAFEDIADDENNAYRNNDVNVSDVSDRRDHAKIAISYNLHGFIYMHNGSVIGTAIHV